MRIAFLNSSLEPGRDGVGDYTRLLSEECVRQGHDCCRVALNDRHVTEAKTSESGGVTELRLPASLPWPQRIAQAKQLLDTFAPDWVSLQFVCYGFHPKGLIFGLTPLLGALKLGRLIHIMFHELWIGEMADAPLRQQMTGSVQKKLIMQMARQLAPAVVQTTNRAYQHLLRREKLESSLLPLFGNVPVQNTNGDDWIFARLTEKRNIYTQNRENFRLFGFFGGLPPNWTPEPTLSVLKQYGQKHHRRIVVLSVGDLITGEPLWQELSRRYASEMTFVQFGRQSAERVSEYLNSLDFGLAVTAPARIGKSGSVAAMLDHGLPVIVSQQERFRRLTVPDDEENPLLYSLERFEQSIGDGIARQPPRPRLPGIAAQYLKELQKVTPEVGSQTCAV